MLPLDNRVDSAVISDLVRALKAAGVSVITDESMVSIGRRYARMDEIGTPFAVTVDFEGAIREHAPALLSLLVAQSHLEVCGLVLPTGIAPVPFGGDLPAAVFLGCGRDGRQQKECERQICSFHEAVPFGLTPLGRGGLGFGGRGRP